MKNLFIKFKQGIINFIKGLAIGVAMIVPGVSGGTLALMLGIYSDIIDAVNGIFKHFQKSIKTLLPIILGALVGFLLLVVPIKYGLEKCPLVVITLFSGFIIGGLPSLYSKVHGHESIAGFIPCFLAIIFMIGTCFLVSKINFSTDDLLFHMNFGLFMYLVLAGFIISTALVMPGISGSMMLMVMGLYMSILTIIKDNIFHFTNFGNALIVMIPLFIGVIFGFFLISFIMGKLLKNHEVGTYFVIIGLVIGSLGTIFYLNLEEIISTYTIPQIIISIICLVLGFLLTFFLDRYFKKKTEEIKEANNDEIR